MDFKNHLKKYLNEEEINLLINSFCEPSRHAALLNIRKMNDETFLSLFPHVMPHPLVAHAYIYNKDEYDLGKSIYHLLGCFYLQEPSAMIPSSFLNPKEDDIVLDMCAAPGGKMVQASFLMNNKGLILANDISKSRLNAVIENVERLGIGNVIIINNDFSKIKNLYHNTFSKIILDAPCSGSGMFRKDEKMLKDWSYQKVLKYSALQKELILHAYEMLSIGGEMVYSTCSYSFEEDEEVIEYLLEHSDAEIVNIEKNEFLYQSKILPYGVHLFPYLFNGEGQYICLIRKPGKIIKKLIKQEKNIAKPLLNYFDKSLSYIQKYGDTYFGLTSVPPLTLKGLNIIRLGIKIGEQKDKTFYYAYHYSHFIDEFEHTVIINNEESEKYLHGETLNKLSFDGFNLLKYQDINVCLAKSNGLTIKNYFPKGLRK